MSTPGDTKEQMLRRLGSRPKDDLVDTLAAKLTKEDLVSILGSRLKKDELAAALEEEPQRRDERRRRSEHEAQAPAPRRDSAAVLPGLRVRVDISGLPMLGVFAGRGASAAGTITEVDDDAGWVRVHLDAGMDGRKAIDVPISRVRAEPA